MCRAATSSRAAKRCPVQSNPEARAKSNERRRKAYAKKHSSTDATAVATNETVNSEPFRSIIKLMGIEEATRLISAEEYTAVPHNPYVKRLYGEDGSSMLYVPIENVIPAMVNDVADLGLGYKLPQDKVIDGYRTTPYLKQKLQEDIDSSDVFKQGFTVKDILYRNHSSVTDGVAAILSDPRTEIETRNRWFNHFGHEEQVIRDADNYVMGYAYSYRPKEPVSVAELNPSLARKPKEEGYEDYLWSQNIIETFQGESGDFDVPIRDEYFTTMESMIKEHGHPKRGAYRIVFDRGDTVVKLPLNADGISDNSREFLHSKGQVEEYYEGVPLAPCHLEYTEKGMPFLVMEKVDMVDMDEADYPEWAHKIDAFQLGRSRVTGKLVAYDL